MIFLITLIALIIERFFHWSHLRNWQWFARYQHFLNIRVGTWPRFLLLAACVLPPVILAGLIGCILGSSGYNIPKLIFGVLVLLYCLGPNNLWLQIYSCLRSFNTDDPHGAILQVKQAFGITAVDQPQAFHQAFTRAIFIAANERIFAVIFWFALFGPAGAILYRSISLCRSNDPASPLAQAALQVQRVLDWVPVRLFTIIFALGGNFTHVLARWKQYARDDLHSNEVMLGECGVAALSMAKEDILPEDGTAEKEALALLDRAFVIGLVILAVAMLVT